MDRDTVFVVGGGPSLSKINFSKLSSLHTICINQAVLDTPNPDYLITCDYTFLRKVDINKIRSLSCSKFFVANFIGPDLQEKNGQIIDTRCHILYDLSPFDVIIKARERSGLGGTFRDFRSGGCSGYCGFQLAFLLGYRNIVLLGIDLQTEGLLTHYHRKYTTEVSRFKKCLDSYYVEFEKGIAQLKSSHPEINVCTGTPSRLNNIIPLVQF